MAVKVATGGKADWSPSIPAGAYTNVPQVRKWTLSPSTETKEYASSSTAGAKKRISATNDFEGTIDLYTDDTVGRFDGAAGLGIVNGAEGTFKLYEDAAKFHVAESFIDSVDYEVDIEGGEIVGATINFSGNGVWTKPV